MLEISIIIPVYKSKSTIKNTILSITNQLFISIVPKIEIILVIDDNDNYENYLNLKKDKIKIRIIKTKKIGSGPGNARNIGFQNARGKFIGFLDSDDQYSQNYLNEMIKNINREKILISVTHIYKKNKKILELNVKKNKLTINELIKYPGSFHPFIDKKLFKDYLNIPSQDIYNLTEFLNERDIKIIKNAHYILNINDNSLTQKICFKHKIKKAYKYYLVKSIKKKKIKISQHFAKRIILNKKYERWIKKNKDISFYEYIGLLNEYK